MKGRPIRPAETPELAFVDVAGTELAVLRWPMRAPALPPGLTEAERAVVSMIVAGASNAAIARARGTSPRTVANQVAQIFRKLGVGARGELAALIARRAG